MTPAASRTVKTVSDPNILLRIVYLLILNDRGPSNRPVYTAFAEDVEPFANAEPVRRMAGAPGAFFPPVPRASALPLRIPVSSQSVTWNSLKIQA
jgi:hypothetical protein